MRPFLRTVLLSVSIAVLLSIAAQAQSTWKPAIRFSKYLGKATYLPGLGECGYVQFANGPNGVREGIYDLKTLSDTSTVICDWPGGGVPYSAGFQFDIEGNGRIDAWAPTLDKAYLDICTTTQRMLALARSEQNPGFAAGFADIDGNGIREYFGGYHVLISLAEDGQSFTKRRVLSRHTLPDDVGLPTDQQPSMFYLGTLSGIPRLLVVTRSRRAGTNYLRFVLETLTPEQVQSDSATLTLSTITYTDSPLEEFIYERLFIFPDVWYMGGQGGKTWVITADTMVLVDRDPSMGNKYWYAEHYGQQLKGDGMNYCTIDATRVELIAADFASLLYVQLHAEGTRIRVEELGRITPMLNDGVSRFHPSETAVVGDIDGDGLEDVILSGSTGNGKESQLYLTTGRFLSSVLENGSQTTVLAHSTEGWLIPNSACIAPDARRAAVYDVQGSLVAMTDVVPLAPGMLVRNVSLQQGVHFAVVGSCVFRLQ